MCYKYICLVLVLLHIPCNMQALKLAAKAQQHMALTILLDNQLGDEPGAYAIIRAIEDDLQFTKQFSVKRSASVPTPLKLVIQKADDGAIAWLLFDQCRAKLMQEGKVKQARCERAQAHAIADEIWQALTNTPGFFSTRIAYCKEVPSSGRTLKHIYIADYNGAHEQLLVDTPTVNMAPRWNNDPQRPLIFYSEFADANVRMMYIDMHKRRKVASNFDGINMCPSFSHDGKKAVFCASHGTGNAQLYYIDEKKNLRQLTNNHWSNFCPTLSDDGQKVYFCSDYGRKQPSLFCFDLRTNKLESIPDTACCESPSFCSVKNSLAYCKAVDRIMQLFIYDVAKKEPKQLSFDRTAKHDVTWSPCGNYLLFGQDFANKSQLCIMNIHSKQQYIIAQSDQRLSFPAWSPRYIRYPVV